VLSSSFHQGGELSYGRESNPTWEPLEEVIGWLEGGHARAFASGMAAISAVLERLPTGSPVVYPAGAYSGTRRLLGELSAAGRVVCVAADVTDTEATLEACRHATAVVSRGSGLLWLESPTNPLLGIADLRALADGAHDLGMEVAADNTFATPLLQRPLELGVDIVVHSATKLLAGHSDVLLGLTVAAREDLLEELSEFRTVRGAVPGPFEAWLVLRGVRTLAVRLQRAQANAGELARRLVTDTRVHGVRYPGLPEDPGHELAARQMRGFGTMIAFEITDGAAPPEQAAKLAEAVVDATRLATAATSLGGVETLIERRGRWAGEAGLPPTLIRLSVGIEDVDDLWADLDSALRVAGR
jgi:cystathionine gamma-synthase